MRRGAPGLLSTGIPERGPRSPARSEPPDVREGSAGGRRTRGVSRSNCVVLIAQGGAPATVRARRPGRPHNLPIDVPRTGSMNARRHSRPSRVEITTELAGDLSGQRVRDGRRARLAVDARGPPARQTTQLLRETPRVRPVRQPILHERQAARCAPGCRGSPLGNPRREHPGAPRRMVPRDHPVIQAEQQVGHGQIVVARARDRARASCPSRTDVARSAALETAGGPPRARLRVPPRALRHAPAILSDSDPGPF